MQKSCELNVPVKLPENIEVRTSSDSRITEVIVGHTTATDDDDIPPEIRLTRYYESTAIAYSLQPSDNGPNMARPTRPRDNLLLGSTS